MANLLRWLCWDDGCLMRLPMRYILSRLSLNMNVFCGWSLVVVRAMKKAYIYVCRMFSRPRSLYAKCKSFFQLYTPEPPRLPMPMLV